MEKPQLPHHLNKLTKHHFKQGSIMLYLHNMRDEELWADNASGSALLDGADALVKELEDQRAALEDLIEAINELLP